MRNFYKIMAMAIVAVAAAVLTGCSSDDDFLSPYEESAIKTRATNVTNAIINFDNAPADVMTSDQYGNNLYTATAAENQVTTGYLTQSVNPARISNSRSTIFHKNGNLSNLGDMNIGMAVLPFLTIIT